MRWVEHEKLSEIETILKEAIVTNIDTGNTALLLDHNDENGDLLIHGHVIMGCFCSTVERDNQLRALTYFAMEAHRILAKLAVNSERKDN